MSKWAALQNDCLELADKLILSQSTGTKNGTNLDQLTRALNRAPSSFFAEVPAEVPSECGKDPISVFLNAFREEFGVDVLGSLEAYRENSQPLFVTHWRAIKKLPGYDTYRGKPALTLGDSCSTPGAVEVLPLASIWDEWLYRAENEAIVQLANYKDTDVITDPPQGATTSE